MSSRRTGIHPPERREAKVPANRAKVQPRRLVNGKLPSTAADLPAWAQMPEKELARGW